MKEGGRAVVGVPTTIDKIYFNGHRLYGKTLYKHIFSNWKVLYTEVGPKNFHMRQIVIILMIFCTDQLLLGKASESSITMLIRVGESLIYSR